MAAIAESGRIEEVVDGLLLVAMFYGKGPWRDIEDWVQAISDLFDLIVRESDVLAARDRAVEAKKLVYNSYLGQYGLSAETYAATVNRIEAGDDLERRAQASWLVDVEELVHEILSETLWSCLLAYARKAFLSHGQDAIKLLDASADDLADIADDETPEALLQSAMEETGLDSKALPEISDAVAIFFDGKDATRVQYVAELANSTFNFLALNLDDEVRNSLLASLPSLSIFVDTNVIYGLLGAHANPLGAAAVDLFAILRENEFPFRLYYHEKTLRELENTMDAIGARLRRERTSQAVSKALLRLPRTMSSIEVRYHQINSETPTSVDVFLGRFSNLPVLLAEYGLTIYRESTHGSEQESRRRAELVAEYAAYLEENGREKSYSAMDHDVSIWIAAASRQIPGRKGPLFSGALVISADYTFRNFDRRILSREFGSGTWLVTRPDTLLQALHPFEASPQHSDAVFAKIFATPEFRGIGRDYSEVVSQVASYLATYDNLPEDTATKLLTNAMLMTRLKEFDSKTEEFQRAIQEELVNENEMLLRERNEAVHREHEIRAGAAREQEVIRREVSEISAQLSETEENSALADRMAELAKRLDKITEPGSTVNIGSVYMEGVTDYSGGYFDNKQTQVGAQGPQAVARDFTQQADQRLQITDLGGLATELETLKQQLISEASSAMEYQAVAEIQAAKEAASNGDEVGIKDHLAKAGRWALDVAMRIGTEMAAAAINHAIGVG